MSDMSFLWRRLPCLCCWHFRPIYYLDRWGGRFRKPICLYCKMVGCERCG